MTYRSVAGIAALMVAGITLVAMLRLPEKSDKVWYKAIPAQDEGAYLKAEDLRSKGDFEGAIAAALKGIGGNESDDALLQLVADLYFARTQVEPSKRELFVDLGLTYAKKAVGVNPDDVVNVYNLGASYELAGINSRAENHCSYFAESLRILRQVRAMQFLKQESGIIEGQEVKLEPYRIKLDNKIADVEGLFKSCK